MRVLALTDTFSGLPQSTQAIVSIIAVLAVAALGVTISRHDVADTRWVIIATVGGFFLVDLFYIHPEVWENVPALLYWVAKPVTVYIGMFGAAVILARRTSIDNRLVLVASGIAGIVLLQLYYTVVPIPVVGGEAIQVGLVENLTGGVAVHGVGLLVALAVVLVGMKVT